MKQKLFSDKLGTFIDAQGTSGDELNLFSQAMAGVYQLRREDADKFETCNVQAYRQYPLMKWFLGEAILGEKLNQLLRTEFQCIVGNDLIIADSDQVNSVAVWMAPGTKGIDTLTYLRHGGLRLIRYWPKLIGYETYTQKTKQRLIGDDCWYLQDLAVRPEMQGRGLASKVIRPVLALCDATGKDAFLETHDPKNVPMYEHFGFELIEVSQVPGSGLKHYAMRRSKKGKKVNY